MNFKSCLYLIPNLIGATDVDDVLPKNLYSQISHIRHFIVEDIRNARRFLRSLSKDFVIDDLTFYELNKHTEIEQIEDYLKVSEQGLDIGLLSEAGLPCVADPGNLIVQLAHKKNIRVKPLSGPSSIFMDTPFRNDKLLSDLLSTLNPETYLCVASNISCEDEMIIRKKVADWKKINISLNKKPCIFII